VVFNDTTLGNQFPHGVPHSTLLRDAALVGQLTY
jgi:hypothetical protein